MAFGGQSSADDDITQSAFGDGGSGLRLSGMTPSDGQSMEAVFVNVIRKNQILPIHARETCAH